MKRDFLTDLGVEGEVVDKIMREYGKSVNALKDEKDALESKASTVDDLKQQITDRDTQLEGLKLSAKGNEALTAQIEELKTANEQTATEYQSKLDKQAFDYTLEKVLMSEKARNPKAVKALLDIESIKLDGTSLIGLEDQLKALKESDAYLFGEADVPGLKGRKPNLDGGAPTGITKEQFDKMDYGQKVALYNSDIETYQKLV